MGGSSNYHARSKSLPTRPHPLVTECDEHLCRLKAQDSAPWTAAAMAKKLAGLQDLQECVNKLLLLRRTRDAFETQRREKWVDEVFEGSLRLLDLCSAAKDGVIHTKECVRELQSLVRRRSSTSNLSCGNGVANQVEKYLASRKVVKRAIQKVLANVKTYGTKPTSISIKDIDTTALITLLFDVEVASVSVFEALMCYVLGKKGKAKGSGWALVSKLMRSKRASLTEETAEGEANEFATLDAAVDTVASRLASDNASVGGSIESMGDQLGKLEGCVQDLEGGLEGLFRRLIRNRVSLLNIINN